MALSPEEQAELQQLESELSTDSASTGGLSQEERIEMQALEADLGETPEQSPEEPSNMVMEAGSTLAAASRKVARGYLPITNQVSAVLSSITDYATDPIADAIYGTSSKPSSFGEKYSRNLELIREQAQQDDEDLGLAGTALEIAGAASSLGGVTKLLGLSSKGAANIAKTGLVDAVYAGLSFTDSKGYDKDTIGVMKMGGGLSMVTQIALGPLGRLVGKLGSGALGKADEALLAANVGRYADQTADGLKYMKSNHGPDSIKKSMKELDMTNPDLANDLPKFKENVDKVIGETGDKIRTAYEALDAYTGGVPIDADELLKSVKSTIVNSKKSAAGKQEALTKIIPELQTMFTNTKGNYNIKTITDLFDTISDMNNGNVLAGVTGKDKEMVFGVLRNQLKKSRSKVTAQLEMGVAQSKRLEELMNTKPALEQSIKDAYKEGLEDMLPRLQDSLESVDEGIATLKKMGVSVDIKPEASRIINDPKSIQFVMDSLEKNNSKYARLSDFNKKVLSNKLPSATGGYITNALRKAMTPKGIMGAIAGNAVGGKAGAVVGAAGIGMSSKVASKLGAFVESYAGKTKEESVRQGLLKVGDFFKSTAQYNTDPVFRALSATIAKNLSSDSDVSPDEAWVNINSAMSKAKLYASPISRDNDSVIENFENIMAIASKESPALASSLADAMNNQEDAGPIMDQLSKSPGMAKFFKAGFGWGGKVYSDEDKAVIVNEIKSQVNVPSVVKSQYIKSVLSTGQVPDMSQIPRRERIQYVPRDRKKVR